MKTDALSDIRARLWDSLEMAHVRFQLIAWTVGYAIALAVCCVNGLGVPLVTAMMAAFVSVLFVPILGFWLLRIWRIFQSLEEYVFCPTELDQPHSYPLNRNSFAFMAVIEEPQGKRFAVETHSIFRVRNIPGPKLRDYVGRTVTLAWNPRTDMVVVIG